MFSTFRHRLLFWFLVFISSNFIIISLSIAYIQKRERILTTTDLIESSYLTLLNNVLAQQDFFSYETKNGAFFETGQSIYLNRYNTLLDSTFFLIDQIKKVGQKAAFDIPESLSPFALELSEMDTLFTYLVEKVKQRGYKDFNLEGEMRADAHWLEENQGFSAQDLLMLRRHEKDYIIRNEQNYVDRLNKLVEQLKSKLETPPLDEMKRAEMLRRLESYQFKFNQIVDLDREIGIKDNTGLKLQLDIKINRLEKQFYDAVKMAEKQQRQMFANLNRTYGVLVGLLILLSILLSYVISKRVTRPLTDLTQFITKFVDSSFTYLEANPLPKSRDEIGKLTQNFTIMKDEVISSLNFFKQKVDERTAELAQANERLKMLNEANSRFVPVEFLNFLGRKSIEEVNLGDQIENELTVMFTDIRSFTKISEGLSPQENFDFINKYLSLIVPVIQKNGGFIDKFIGDSVMALFPNGAAAAINTALQFNEELASFNQGRIAEGKEAVEVGAGIHTGRLILGTIGHNQRLETTVISDAVNIASRVEGLTKHYHAKVIVTEETLSQLPSDHHFHYRFLGKVKVKGKSKNLAVYECLTESETLKLSYQQEYENALELIEKLAFDQAVQLLSLLAEKNPEDGAVARLLKRCRDYAENGLPEDWDGVEHMKAK